MTQLLEPWRDTVLRTAQPIAYNHRMAETMNAAAQIAYWCATMATASDRAGLLMNCAHVEFYIEQFEQSFIGHDLFVPLEMAPTPTVETIFGLQLAAGNILQEARKAWAEGTPPDMQNVKWSLALSKFLLGVFYEQHGISRDLILRLYQEKVKAEAEKAKTV